nr:hypothetical protein [Tanacetum cinerariifolium]
MLHISPRIPNQPFADLPTKEEILDFLRFLGHSHDIRYLTDVNVNKLYQPWRSFASVINKCLTGKSSGVDSFKLNSKAYKEYHACVMGEAAPKPKASARKKKGDSASSTTPPTPPPTTTVESAPRLSATAKGKQTARATTPNEPTDVQRTEAEQLKLVLKRSRHEMHISQQSGSGTDEGTGSKPGVPDVPILPIELTTAEIRNSKAYQEYYACALGETAPKPKANTRKKKGDSASSTTPPTPTLTTTAESAPRLSASAKENNL